MRAAIYAGKGQPVTIESIPDPEPGDGEVLIRVHRCGICGTDLSMTKGEMWDYGSGVQFGHEYAGEIVALGKGVDALKIGQKIAVNPSGACGHCEGCAGMNHVMCREPGAAKGFAELATVPAYLALPLPNTLSMADGALIEPLAVSLYGVRMSPMKPGDKVLVLGGGTVALNTIYWARRLGAGKIVALSRSDRRQDLCLAMGADAYISAPDTEVDEVREALGGTPDSVFECVGSPGLLGKAINHAKTYGNITSLGFCTQPDPIMPALPSYKCLTMQFLVGYRMEEFLHIADQMGKGHVDPKLQVTSAITLDALPETMTILRGPNQETKVHVRF